MTDSASARLRAMRHLEHFIAESLPTALRQMSCWSGLNTRAHPDVVDDLIGELAVDCLEHAESIAAMNRRDRHNRWFRLVEQAHYRLRLRGQRRVIPDAERWLVDPEIDGNVALEHLTGLSPNLRGTLKRLPDAAQYLRNGRLNLEGTSRHLRVRPQLLRSLWTSVAERLGYDEEFLRFWRRRLVEALLGLAADLLRDTGGLRIYDEHARSRPDPVGRIRRLRRIRQRVSIRPLPGDMKRALTRFSGAGGPPPSALEILDMAAGIEPDNPAVQLWRFEALIVERRLRAATRALRAARRAGAEGVRVVLARARLLEARSREHRARRLLRRAAGARRDPRLDAALNSLRSG